MIRMIPYQAHWPIRFQQIAALLSEATKTWHTSVYHIGSTAVPGLAAKDVIDIQISVNTFDPQMEMELTRIGFTRIHNLLDHRPAGREELDSAQLYKWFFQQDNPAVNLHVRKRGMFNERYALLCRDYLRADPHAARAYEAIKLSLAKHFPDDVTAYYEIKDPVFDVLMAGAELWASAVSWDTPSKRFVIAHQ